MSLDKDGLPIPKTQEHIDALERVKAWQDTPEAKRVMQTATLASALTGIDSYSFIIGLVFQQAAARAPFAPGQSEKIAAILGMLREALKTADAEVNPPPPGTKPEDITRVHNQTRMYDDMLALSQVEMCLPDYGMSADELGAAAFGKYGPMGHA